MGEHTIRNMRLRNPIHAAQIQSQQHIAYWRYVAKALPPHEILDALEEPLRCNPPVVYVDITLRHWEEALEQIEEWRAERHRLEDETLRWANMTDAEDE